MDVYRSFTDSELVERLNRKDKAALEQVYLRYWAGLFHYASRLLRDEATAEDLVHDLFTYLINNMDRLNIKTPLDAYLYKAIRNRVINAYDKQKNRQKYIDSLKSYYQQGEYVTDEQILEKEMKQRIEQAVATFPKKMREVYELSRTHQLTRREIAQATNTTESTVDTQLTRALKILRSRLTAIFL